MYRHKFSALWMLTLSVLGGVFLMGFLLSGTPTLSASSTGARQAGDARQIIAVAPGIRAIQPSKERGDADANTPAFLEQDVVNYINQAPNAGLGPGVTLNGTTTVTKVEFITAGTLDGRDPGANINQPDDTLLSYVELQGDFSVPGSPGAGGSEALTGCGRAFIVFNAHTGNRLMFAVDCSK